MTDNEIIEQLIQFLETGHCTRKWSDREYAILILSLIKRQKAEIEKLQAEISILKNENAGVIPVAFGDLIRTMKGLKEREDN